MDNQTKFVDVVERAVELLRDGFITDASGNTTHSNPEYQRGINQLIASAYLPDIPMGYAVPMVNAAILYGEFLYGEF